MIKTPAHYEEISIWSDKIPFSSPEDANIQESRPKDEWGIIRIHNVTEPSIKYFPASGQKPHPAVLICPGGSYEYQAVNHEGYDIAGWLNSIGFSAFVLKYRCPQKRQAAHADAARAMRFIRANADALEIDPERLGCIGFSAGAHLCATISAPASEIPYEPTDDIDTKPFRPNFTALIYPAYLADKETLKLEPEFSVNTETPSTFIIQTEDDVINVENAISWYLAMKRSGRPCEMHLYAEGGHGYGVFRRGFPVNEWVEPAGKWFRREAKLN